MIGCLNQKSSNLNEFYSVIDSEFDMKKKDIVTEKYLFQLDMDDIQTAKELVPKKNELSKIEKLIKKPNFSQLEVQESILFWKYRYFLCKYPNALVKFLRAVKWNNKTFSDEALSLISTWKTIKYDDALFLLSRSFSMNPIYKTDLEINEEDTEKIFGIIR